MANSLGGFAGVQETAHQGRRLYDKIMLAFHHACDLQDVEIAGLLLQALEVLLARKPATNPANRRRNMESLVTAHERLWSLRHPVDAG